MIFQKIYTIQERSTIKFNAFQRLLPNPVPVSTTMFDIFNLITSQRSLSSA